MGDDGGGAGNGAGGPGGTGNKGLSGVNSDGTPQGSPGGMGGGMGVGNVGHGLSGSTPGGVGMSDEGFAAHNAATAAAQSDAQSKQNNAESAMASLGYSSAEIGERMGNINNLPESEREAALDHFASEAVQKDFNARDFFGKMGKLNTLNTARKVGADMSDYGEAIGKDAATSVLGFAAGTIMSSLIGPLGQKLGSKFATSIANKVSKDFNTNVAKFGLSKAQDMARAQMGLHGTPGSPGEGGGGADPQKNAVAKDQSSWAGRGPTSDKVAAEGEKKLATPSQNSAVKERQKRQQLLEQFGQESTILTSGKDRSLTGDDPLSAFVLRTRGNRTLLG